MKILVDSGGDRSLIDKEMAKNLGVIWEENKRETILNALGSAMSTIGETKLQIKLNDLHYQKKFTIVENLKEKIILGVDFMKKRGGVIIMADEIEYIPGDQ